MQCHHCLFYPSWLLFQFNYSIWLFTIQQEISLHGRGIVGKNQITLSETIVRSKRGFSPYFWRGSFYYDPTVSCVCLSVSFHISTENLQLQSMCLKSSISLIHLLHKFVSTSLHLWSHTIIVISWWLSFHRHPSPSSPLLSLGVWSFNIW